MNDRVNEDDTQGASQRRGDDLSPTSKLHNLPQVPPSAWPNPEPVSLGEVRTLKRLGGVVPPPIYWLVEEVRELERLKQERGDSWNCCYKGRRTFRKDFGWSWCQFSVHRADAFLLGLLWEVERPGRTTLRRVPNPLPDEEELQRWKEFVDWAHRELPWWEGAGPRNRAVQLRRAKFWAGGKQTTYVPRPCDPATLKLWLTTEFLTTNNRFLGCPSKLGGGSPSKLGQGGAPVITVRGAPVNWSGGSPSKLGHDKDTLEKDTPGQGHTTGHADRGHVGQATAPGTAVSGTSTSSVGEKQKTADGEAPGEEEGVGEGVSAEGTVCSAETRHSNEEMGRRRVGEPSISPDAPPEGADEEVEGSATRYVETIDPDGAPVWIPAENLNGGGGGSDPELKPLPLDEDEEADLEAAPEEDEGEEEDPARAFTEAEKRVAKMMAKGMDRDEHHYLRRMRVEEGGR